MNADDRAPAGESQQSFNPPQDGGGIRRTGVMPTSSSVPQRTAFRPVTGTQTTSPRPAGAQPPSAPQPTHRPSPERTGSHPTGVPAARTAAPSTTESPTGPRLPRPETGSQPAGDADNPSGEHQRSVSVAAGVGKLKGLGNKAKDKITSSDASKPASAIGPRKVRVLVSRLDPWSALKIGFLLSIALGIMFVVAVHILWSALNAMGTIDLINEWVQKLFTTEQEVNILQFINYGKVMSAALLVAVTNVVLISGLSVVGAFLYNTVSRVVGGVYLTLTDD